MSGGCKYRPVSDEKKPKNWSKCDYIWLSKFRVVIFFTIYVGRGVLTANAPRYSYGVACGCQVVMWAILRVWRTCPTLASWCTTMTRRSTACSGRRQCCLESICSLLTYYCSIFSSPSSGKRIILIFLCCWSSLILSFQFRPVLMIIVAISSGVTRGTAPGDTL